ncbi:MAG: phenylalanine--tRNA ligase subunit beta, partial [Endozoicomonas sp.]
TRLGLGLESSEEGLWTVSVPSWRFDIAIEEDLVEELGRIYGYNHLPETIPTAMLKMKQVDEAQVQESDLRRVLTARGYQEAVTFSFIDPQLHKQFDPQREPVALANPIASDLSVMRTTLLPGLVKTAAYNLNRQQTRVRLFETGLTFVKESDKRGETLTQASMLAALITGDRYPEGWQIKSESVDFFDLKGDFEALLNLGQAADEFCFDKGSHPTMHPGQCAQISRDGQVIGHMGAIHPSLAKPLAVPEAVYLVEVSLSELTRGQVTSFEPLSKFPEVRRDLAFIVQQSVSAGHLEQVIREEAGELLRDLRTFDVYSGKGVEESHKSLAIGLTLQHPSRTLRDDEVNPLIDRVLSRLEQEFNARLRQ